MTALFTHSFRKEQNEQRSCIKIQYSGRQFTNQSII
ncbi:hypothetical protein CF65_02025 [Aggregatibacter actinomycetemcomitans HK1651]|nr:hypothetical protein CF65_02025 [Aggregatibacter actinomycetemcomitans HK1651]